jgi:hypothetical protein
MSDQQVCRIVVDGHLARRWLESIAHGRTIEAPANGWSRDYMVMLAGVLYALAFAADGLALESSEFYRGLSLEFRQAEDEELVQNLENAIRIAAFKSAESLTQTGDAENVPSADPEGADRPDAIPGTSDRTPE